MTEHRTTPPRLRAEGQFCTQDSLLDRPCRTPISRRFAPCTPQRESLVALRLLAPQIRRARVQQLQQQAGANSPASPDHKEQQQQREAEARASLLAQILDASAADRLSRIRLVNASHATSVEDQLMMLARTGQLRQRVTEEQLKELLGAVAEQKRERDRVGKVVVSRRKGADDDDDLEDLLDNV